MTGLLAVRQLLYEALTACRSGRPLTEENRRHGAAIEALQFVNAPEYGENQWGLRLVLADSQLRRRVFVLRLTEETDTFTGERLAQALAAGARERHRWDTPAHGGEITEQAPSAL